jgi:uncharacterized membrane protein
LERPKITITPSPFDKTLDISSTVLLFVIWALTIVAFIQMPETIPTHYNGSGKVDDYGSKLSILMLPVIATAVYWGITILNRYPHIFNYPADITEENAEVQYILATRMLRFVKLAIIIIFTELVLSTYLISIGILDGLGKWSLPIELALMFIPITVIIVQMLRHRKNRKSN